MLAMPNHKAPASNIGSTKMSPDSKGNLAGGFPDDEGPVLRFPNQREVYSYIRLHVACYYEMVYAVSLSTLKVGRQCVLFSLVQYSRCIYGMHIVEWQVMPELSSRTVWPYSTLGLFMVRRGVTSNAVIASRCSWSDFQGSMQSYDRPVLQDAVEVDVWECRHSL